MVAGIIFAILSFWMLSHAIVNLRQARKSEYWPTTEGKLIDLVLWGKRNVGGEMREVDKLRVSFEFEVNGKVHSGSDVAFYSLVYPETLIFYEKHVHNQQVSVHYNPVNPMESVLIPGIKPGNKGYSEITLAVIGVVVSIGIIVAASIGLIG